MATNSLDMSEDAEMADGDGENVVTMMDVLREQQNFEEDANAVLGASDDKNCTYAKGYVKRQAIYACLTCCPEAVTDPTKRAGVCLACSLACHENHELVELYTKRNFRCDCGNPKFSQPCQFTPNKTDLNYENKYNQNFIGIYCNCKRPYPDPESTEEEEMIQCIVCEDWLHTNHLEATVPSSEQYAEMICKDCMEDIDFLHDYSDLVVNVEDKEIIVMDPDLDVTSIIKAKESPKKELSNDEAESKEDETLPDTIDSNLDGNKKDETSTDVLMSESKPDEDCDGNDSSKEDTKNAEQCEHETEASGDTKPDTATSESKENQEVDNIEVKKDDENIKPETNNESDEKENSGDQTTAAEESNEQNAEADNKNNDEITKPESTEAESAKHEETTETESLDKEVSKAEVDSVTDTKNETVTTKANESADDKPQEDEIKEDSSNSATSGDKPQEDKIKEDSSNNATSDKENELPANKVEHKRKLSEGDIEVSPKKQKLDSKPCLRPRGVKRVYKGATFWPPTLRQKLCTCAECLSMYKDLAVLFLIDPEDTVSAYETLGKENTDGAASSEYEKGLQALSSLDRVQQINALTEFNKMRDKLLDFLKSFKDRKEIVKEEDIKAFFAGMKPKREPDGVYFCR